MTCQRTTAGLFLCLALANAVTARAETPGDASRPSGLTDGAVRAKPMTPVIDMADARASFSLRYAQAGALAGAESPNRTAIDHSFASRSLVGSLGYLCGVNSAAPGAEDHGGPASSFGHGTTFLGARISYAFR